MQIGMYELLCKAQEMIARKYPTILTDKSKRGEIKNYIAQFLYDTGYTVDGYSMKQVTDRLFSEMAEYSFLTAYLNDPNIEEININGWDDVALTYLDGHIEKSDEQFFSPGHAVDIIKRLLLHSGMTIDALPMFSMTICSEVSPGKYLHSRISTLCSSHSPNPKPRISHFSLNSLQAVRLMAIERLKCFRQALPFHRHPGPQTGGQAHHQ